MRLAKAWAVSYSTARGRRLVANKPTAGFTKEKPVQDAEKRLSDYLNLI